jgi:hypothetical protein
MSRRWTVTGTKRKRLAPGVRVNIPVGRALRLITGQRRRGETLGNLVSWTLGKPGAASWNSRHDDIHLDTPGPGGVRGRARRPRTTTSGTRRRRAQLDADEHDPQHPRASHAGRAVGRGLYVVMLLAFIAGAGWTLAGIVHAHTVWELLAWIWTLGSH